MNWAALAAQLPTIILGAMQLAQTISNATGPAKKAAVIAAIPDALALTEFGIGKDLVNDQAVKLLISSFIDAQKAAMNAHDALKAGVLAKAN